MNKYELMLPCHFGMEAMTKKEVKDLGYEIKDVKDGRVAFMTDAAGIARSNIFLRTTERVLLKVGEFKAYTWDDLFEGIKALPWEEYIPENGSFWVTKANSIKSKLFSSRDIQSIAKKAMVDRLSKKYKITWFKEDGEKYPVRIFIYKDLVTVCLDTSGDSLHKRGYRLKQGKAPITETLAAALIMLSGWRDDRPFVDPMCGSGTFPIEAAMMAAHIAPGMNREFTAEKWTNIIPKKAWYDAVGEANDLIDHGVLENGINSFGKKVDIRGYDLDPSVIAVARENAERAEVENLVHFEQRDIANFSHDGINGFLVTNPPYGERLEDKRNLPIIYTMLGEAYAGLDESWSMDLISSYEDVQKYIGKKADKNRKIYNGMLKCYFYSYNGQWKRWE